MFLSTRPRGARLDLGDVVLGGQLVSIHAPAGGATVKFQLMLVMSTVSIHAPAGGATFISVHLTMSSPSFYPRARGGRDAETIARIAGINKVSIHAPAGGATASTVP